MDEPTAISTIIDTFVHIAKSLWAIPWSRYAASAFHVLAYPPRLAWSPLSWALGWLRALFRPVEYVVSYMMSWVAAAAGVLVSLEPLYTFFSVAAFLGVVAGIIMALLSAIVTSQLGMNDDSDGHEGNGTHRQQRRLEQHQHNMAMLASSSKQQRLQQLYLSDTSIPSAKMEPHGLEPDWHWADTSSPPRYRRVSGLQAQTIHEEDDSE